MVTIENKEVCLKGWMIIMSVSKKDFYRQCGNAILGVQSRHHGNKGTQKQRNATRQGMASLACFIDLAADLMPHRFRTLSTEERVVERVLWADTIWKDIRGNLNEVLLNLSFYVSVQCGLCMTIHEA